MTRHKFATILFTVGVGLAVWPAHSQTTSATAAEATQPPAQLDAEQTADLLGLTAGLKQLTSLQSSQGCASTTSLPEVSLRQQLMAQMQAATLDVDSAIAEINNEQGNLSNLRTSLQMRRDKTVGKYNTAALITGSGAGAAVSATQFTGLGSRTNNIGDGFGIGSGVASTILSVIATEKQNGPRGTVMGTPNMLAPLFDRKPVLNTFYPPVVLHYLQVVPADGGPACGTRLECLKTEWIKSGRLMSDDKAQQKIDALTASDDPSVKVTIQDLSNRIAMLVDVAGRISLMKRDVATMMRSTEPTSQCAEPQKPE